MADTTGQQSSTVAHDITRNPASIWLSPMCDETAHHGEGRTWAAPAPDDTCEDCSEPWVEYVRSDLASVSSASAEGYKLPCDVHLPFAVVIKAGCDISTLKLAMEYEHRPRHFEGNPRSSVPSVNVEGGVKSVRERVADLLDQLGDDTPEPVPATNQAGEVEQGQITARDAQELVRKMYEAEGVDRTKVSLADRHAVQALYTVKRVGNRYVASRNLPALATQPATSQEGEDELRAAFLAWRKAVARHDGFLVEGRDVTSGAVRRSGQRCASTYSALADLAVKALPRLLAATPTPPTLSEDLREALKPFADIADFYDSCEQHPNGCPGSETTGEMVDLTVGDFRRVRAALAQVKA